jgi:4-hydroxythreonine-4-phosphate dehydrogenase
MVSALPRLAITLGDVAGIGPEVAVRACVDSRVQQICRPLIVGHPEIVRRAIRQSGVSLALAELRAPEEHWPTDAVPCWNPPTTSDDVLEVAPGRNDARAGRAAFACLVAAAEAALAKQVDALTTAPLSKAALHLGGHHYPGHTEILAEVCGVHDFGMMLYLPPGGAVRPVHGLGVVHVTLHTSVRSVPDLITTAAVVEKIELIHGFMRRLGCASPRVGVCALNPHAGEEGLFGDEESRVIAPAVQKVLAQGIAAVTGPIPADALFRRAAAGEFDAVVAMYHDQGHIAFKLISFQSAVNVTLGLPIVRTSPSHGTAFDIAWKQPADPSGMISAIEIAARLAASR